MEDVHEPNQGRIMSVPQAIAGELGYLLRQRAVGTEQAKEINGHPDNFPDSFDAFDA
jgi:hypothetical protein